LTEPTTVRMAPLMAYLSLALAISAQAGAAIWWAGTLNTRLNLLEQRVAEVQTASPAFQLQVVDADRRIAVIDERIANILARLEALTAALERATAGQP
jgi:hypothetical protein